MEALAQFLLVVCLAGSFILTKQNPAQHEKCMPSGDQMAVGKKCMTEVTGKDPGDDLAEMEKIFSDEKVKEKIVDCVFMEMKIIEADGFNAENAAKSVADMTAEDGIKAEMVANIKECAGKFDKSKVDDILKCIEDKNDKADNDRHCLICPDAYSVIQALNF